MWAEGLTGSLICRADLPPPRFPSHLSLESLSALTSPDLTWVEGKAILPLSDSRGSSQLPVVVQAYFSPPPPPKNRTSDLKTNPLALPPSDPSGP